MFFVHKIDNYQTKDVCYECDKDEYPMSDIDITVNTLTVCGQRPRADGYDCYGDKDNDGCYDRSDFVLRLPQYTSNKETYCPDSYISPFNAYAEESAEEDSLESFHDCMDPGVL